MSIEINDKSLMMIILLEECNFTCIHCCREDEPMDPGYKLSFKQLQACLADCRSLGSIRWVHFSGGEPTLWAEGSRGLIDLLLEICRTEYTPGFTTNGSFFADYGKCHGFFAKYVDESTMPLRLYFSIDTFHRNFDAKKGRSRSLDNVLKYKKTMKRSKAGMLDIRVIVTVSKDPASLLPDEMIRHYESLGVTFGFVPLICMGKAKSISHLCPDLSSGNPEDWGAYGRYYSEEKRKERAQSGNLNRAAHINLIGGDYYFANPWRHVGQLGQLPDNIIRAYSMVGGT